MASCVETVAADADAPPLPPPRWPSHYKQITRVPFVDGEQSTLDLLDGYIEREEPVILRAATWSIRCT